MTEAAVAVERPSWRMPFGWLVTIALGLAAVAFVAGRHIYDSYGGYRPLALMHVPPTLRYRARVELGDAKRVAAIEPLLRAADPGGHRWPVLSRKLGGASVREVAFGAGPLRDAASSSAGSPSAPSENGDADFVVVLGLQLQAETGLPDPAEAACAVLNDDGIRSEATRGGCKLGDGTLIASTREGALVVASREELVRGLLDAPEIGDRLGFSGPSVRGTAPEPVELRREAAALAARIATRYR